jgi:hypothetical protein
MEFEDGGIVEFVPRLPGESVTDWMERIARESGYEPRATKPSGPARLPYKEPDDDIPTRRFSPEEWTPKREREPGEDDE